MCAVGVTLSPLRPLPHLLQFKLTLLAVHVFVCDSFLIPSCSAVSMEFMGGVDMLQSTTGFDMPSPRPDLSVHPALLSDVGHRIPSAIITASSTQAEVVLDNVIVCYHSAMNYKEPVVLSDPVAAGCFFSRSSVNLVAEESRVSR